MSTTIEERLNDIIDEKDDTITALEAEVETLKRNLDYASLAWQHHSFFKNEGFRKDLPYPRLEMRLERLSSDNWYHIRWVYGIVYRHVVDSLNDNSTMLTFIPISQTEVRGSTGEFSSWYKNGVLETPFRDSLHIEMESITFNLPAYIVCVEKSVYNQITPRSGHDDLLAKMKTNLQQQNNKSE